MSKQAVGRKFAQSVKGRAFFKQSKNIDELIGRFTKESAETSAQKTVVNMPPAVKRGGKIPESGESYIPNWTMGKENETIFNPFTLPKNPAPLPPTSNKGINVVQQQASQAVEKAVNGSTNSVTSTNSFANFMQGMDHYTGLPTMAKNVFKESMNLADAAHSAGYYSRKADGSVDKLNYGKIAGGYFGAAGAMRIASGGGLYKDNQGATDLVGVPFV